jgi:DUF438 domain-containing protein
LKQDSIPLEEQLQQVLFSLDTELAVFSKENEKLREVLAKIHETAVSSREDNTSRLLSEVHQKAGILDAQRLRVTFQKKQRALLSADEADAISSSTTVTLPQADERRGTS